jgi:plastocyanin
MKFRSRKRAVRGLVFVLYLILVMLLVACQPVVMEQPTPTVVVETPEDEIVPETGQTPAVETPLLPPATPTAQVPTETPVVIPEDTPVEDMPEQRVQVSIIDSTYAPEELTITPGTTVIWTNNGEFPHTVTADDGSFNSGSLQSGNRFEHTFDLPGTYPYHCEIHGGPGGVGMSGVISVEAP